MRKGMNTTNLPLFLLIIIVLILWTILFQYDQMNLGRINSSIEKGISFLEKKELPSGEFATYRSRNSDMSNSFYEFSPFTTTIIINSLNSIDYNLRVAEIRNKAIKYIMNEMEPPGILRYYGNNKTNWVKPIPHDLDDTVNALIVLKKNGIEIDKNTTDHLLTFRNNEGLFYTWMVFQDDNRMKVFLGKFHRAIDEIDCVVNAQTLYFYSLYNQTLPEVCDYLNNVIKNNSFLSCSSSYTNFYFFAYVITKAYGSGVMCLNVSIPKIKAYILNTQNLDGSFGNELDTALATVSLLNLKYGERELEHAINRILSTQKPRGNWNSRALYVGDPFIKQSNFGSEELTTAISIEALAKYAKLKESNNR